MMEESSDESAEIITKEEAELASRMQEDPQTPDSAVSKTDMTLQSPPGGANIGVSPPAPLPAFMNVGSNDSTQTPQTGISSIASGTPQQITMPSPSPVSTSKVTAPAPVATPYEVSTQIPVEMILDSPSDIPGGSTGLFGWFSGNRIVSKVMEKTKNSVESMITTLDPGMKEVIRSGGDVMVVVTSTKETKVGAVREAFQTVFGHATVIGVESQANTAAQPVGFTAGLKGAEERIQNLRHKGSLPESHPVISVEGFIVEMLPDRWYEISCLLLQDPVQHIELQMFSQPTPIPAEYILKAQDATPSDYPQRWSGLKVTIGQVIEQSQPHIGHADWQTALVGVSRRESLLLAAKALAYMYKERLPTSFVS
ncbi:protein PRRC1-like [Mizuhopecten yessoensis]|uniref:Protein PRRC1-A n=1 Tax=Mizuhopecten yessoensis TaxID=6573 RepID=A0A210QDW1_MIZYE|nr:protein PRRC1-like [Mizuhopecten yessoensis]OWF46947.1 Protein PRRC1-A [Mizuhopecten yessoensis]